MPFFPNWEFPSVVVQLKTVSKPHRGVPGGKEINDRQGEEETQVQSSTGAPLQPLWTPQGLYAEIFPVPHLFP